MGFERVWLPYLYLYGAGGALFLFGLWLLLRSEAYDRRRRSDRRWVRILLLGFAYYAALHAAGILIALVSGEPAR